MKATFIGEEVEVRIERRPGPPSSFVWRGAEYKVAEVESAATILDFQKSWWRRRHHDDYTVKTEKGEVFKLRSYRHGGTRQWVLILRLRE
jgi:hypothetical protein